MERPIDRFFEHAIAYLSKVPEVSDVRVEVPGNRVIIHAFVDMPNYSRAVVSRLVEARLRIEDEAARLGIEVKCCSYPLPAVTAESLGLSHLPSQYTR